LPTDRESLVWLDVKAIPAVTDGEKKVKTKIMVAVLTRIKLFYRPENLPGHAEDAISNLSWKRTGSNSVTVTNDSPYYVVMNKLSINKEDVKVSIDDNNTVVAPHGQKTYQVKSAPAGSKVTWSAINEYSVVSADKTATL
jgi:P pilus assembly chaperone PapD